MHATVTRLGAIFLLTASAAFADSINDRPYVSVGKNSGEASLQTILDGLGYDVDVIKDQSSKAYFQGGGTASFEILAEVAGYAPYNVFGIYSPKGKAALVFEGSDGVGAKESFSWKGNDLYQGKNLVSKNFGLQFGFFLLTPEGNLFTSDDDLNPNDKPQALIYEGKGKGTGLAKGSLLVAFEDLKLKSSDRDFQDMVVRVKTKNAVPEPSSIALAFLGAGAVMARRRKAAAAAQA